MVVDELKRRISALQRGDAPARQRGATRGARRAGAGLSDHFPDASICATTRGEVFECEAALDEVYSGTSAMLPRYLETFERARQMAERDERHRLLSLLAAADAETAAFIDTETCGLHGRPLFLVGMMWYRGGRPVLTQYFARSYAEEAGLLTQFAQLLPDLKLLITFNGKAFDWPFVRDRMVYHRVECEPSFEHLDLLHPSRRRWRSELPNCRLQTLERYLSGRWRSGDIPSAEIPQRYHDYVREQDARLIAPIFHHNRLDLIAMMELLIALVEAEG